MLAKFFVVFLLFVVSAQARREAAQHIAEIDETLHEVEDVIKQINGMNLHEYEDQNAQILQLIQDLNNLHRETIPLLFLLVNGSQCEEFLRIRSTDLRNVTKVIENKASKIQVALDKAADSLEIESAKKVTDQLQSLSTKMFNISMDLLETTKNAFNRSMSELVITRPLKTKGLTEDEIGAYLDRLQRRLANLKKSVSVATQKNVDFATSKYEKDLKLRSDIENIHHDMKFTTHMNCTVQGMDEEGAYMDVLSHTRIEDLVTALKEIQENLISILKQPKIASYHKDYIANQRKLVLKLIGDIEKYYKVQNTKESNLMKMINEALHTGNPRAVESVDYRALRGARNVRNFIDGLFNISNTPFKRALTAAHEITFFPAAIVAIEEAVTDAKKKGVLTENATLYTIKEIRLAMHNRYALALNMNQTYGDRVSVYLYNVYQLRNYYASNILFQLSNDLRRKKFIQNNEKYWLADVELFITSNLHLIFGTNCNVELYEAYGEIQRNRILRQLYAYQELLRIMRPQDEGVLIRTSLLRRELQQYKTQIITNPVTTATQCSILKPQYKLLVEDAVN